jgi:ABC-2 type transport system ATP-binding protein
MKLEILNLYKSFGEKKVLEDFSFTADSGSAFGLLGRNGQGKTTTIRIIMDIFAADGGAVLIDGKPVKSSGLNIGYLPEERGLYPKHNILTQMVYFGELRGMKAKDAKTSAERLLDKLEASEYLNKRLDTLSKGNQQKIQLAIAIINNPDVVILDEPFSGLDPVNAQILKSLVTELVQQDKIVVFSSHEMASVEQFCDDICIINKGKSVLSGSLKQIKREYPRNRIRVIPENDDAAGLLAFLETDGGIRKLDVSQSVDRNGVVIELRDEQQKAELLRLLFASGIGVDSFVTVEPTLEEIFIERAGNTFEPA